jgi:elongation factor Ts
MKQVFLLCNARRLWEEVGGDIEKARIVLKKKSGAAAEKKADRELGAGFLVVNTQGDTSALITLLCETDFVAKNEEFVNAAKKVAEMAVTEGEAVKQSSAEMINELIQKMGEKYQSWRGESYERKCWFICTQRPSWLSGCSKRKKRRPSA